MQAAASATSAPLGTPPQAASASIALAAAPNPDAAPTSRSILSIAPRSDFPMASIAPTSGPGRAALTALLRHPPGFLHRSAIWDIGSLALVGASP